jgi:hypothetical protein
VVDDEHAAAAQGHEREITVARRPGADGSVVGPQLGVLAERAARRRAGGEIYGRFVLEGEALVPVVGGDPLELLAVLVRDDQVALVGRRPLATYAITA